MGGTIIYGLIVCAGLLLLIVPGIIWALKYSLYGYFVIDRNMGPLEALKASAEATEGAKGELFSLALLLFGVQILGLICLCVGLLFTIPLALVA